MSGKGMDGLDDDDDGDEAHSMRSHAPASAPHKQESVFLERLYASVGEHDGSRVVLALDFAWDGSGSAMVERACSTIDALAGYICSVKINMHLLLPLSMDEIKHINGYAHSHGLPSIADIKLNDIPSTNTVAISHLADSNFDALTINPIIGPDALNDAICNAHSRGMGAIALVYMSHRSAEGSYGMQVGRVEGKHGSSSRLYRVFLEWALASHADGVVVGATRPETIRECKSYMLGAYTHGYRPALFSPGSGAQGGDPSLALNNGADYIIVGRSILYADDPVDEASRLAKISSRPTTNR
ncbi:MAG: orotidine 5'-phosphate decarboxylase [Candidatus Nitrosocaldus sp.]|nr:orotidine 5'-phosphate decarboxylase [Candidatus Nitrosocaldus sp.]MDW8275480.1 orotidine 5'-phosphate decarboxylase [Candidatus Nitrosocaldus sp.]